MQNIFKKIGAILMTMLMTISMISTSAFAANDFKKVQLGSKSKYSYGGTEHGTVLYMTKAGEEVYCLEYNKTPANSYSNKDPNFLSTTKKQDLGLINYYVHQDYSGKDAYAITQSLVWRYMAGSVKSFIKVKGISLTQSKGGYNNYYNQIMKKVRAFDDLPSFSGASKSIRAKQTVTFTDTKGLISSFKISGSKGAKSSISGNTLSVTPDGSQKTVKVRFQKNVNHYETGISVVWTNGSNRQKVGNLKSISDPANASVTLNVLPATGDLHVTKTDITGKKEIAGAVLRVTDETGNKVDEWTSNGSEHVIKNLTSGAKYTLTEVKAPEGYKVAAPITFTLNADGTVTKVSMKDEREPITLKTSATDVNTKQHSGIIGKTAIEDVVSYTNLIRGKKYEVKGKLMDKSTGKALIIDGKEVTASKTFTADKRNGTVTLKYELDSSSLKGKSTVVFEDLYEEGIKVSSHANINDVDQTVNYPDAHTTALDSVTNKHEGNINLTGDTVIYDKYVYTNVTPNKEKTVVTTLMNPDTKKPLLDKEGKAITVTTKFTPKEANGEIIIPIKFNAMHLGAGFKTVVFEDLYDENKNLILAHRDYEDKEQTVEYKSVMTSIQVNKIDSMTKQVIKSKDFKFGIYSDAECTKLLKEVSADTATGTATFKDVKFGTYYIKEIAAPKGYKLSSEVIKVVVDEKLENVGKIYSISYMNTPLPASAGQVQTGDGTTIFGFLSMIAVSGYGILKLIKSKKSST